ncbi:RhuM family protein [Chryseobacterium wangxinyae]|uniref:RhuM family protein n=1 Tax=Chryseobacterium sp. CY350 TaxID=2997336 RepID=UPI002270DAAB|nr:RhuM family protein [Chryseobacterium sp. CY350]MCY0976104.1 virulence RhuM family protein [Chryseobacterium sp. CY350]WBZ94296.1 RhuM family protein [Chryseobacterium sp. CY350]
MIDAERLKQGQNVFVKDYFKELLQKIRSIRASEIRVYQKQLMNMKPSINPRKLYLILIKTSRN